MQEAAVAKNTYTETENIIEIKDLRKVYKVGSESVVALNNINITIKRGEICCFLGTSGSGKSTLLNMMAGLERPTKGTIRIAGWDIDKLSEKACHIPTKPYRFYLSVLQLDAFFHGIRKRSHALDIPRRKPKKKNANGQRDVNCGRAGGPNASQAFGDERRSAATSGDRPSFRGKTGDHFCR